MPANPTHTGLTSQGWNYSLADAKDYVEDYGMLDIGQMYITDDGKTRLYLTLSDASHLSPTLCLYQQTTNGISVDWGDGSSAETKSGTGNLFFTHNYSSTGEYVISLTQVQGQMKFGHTSVQRNILNGENPYMNGLKKIEFGSITGTTGILTANSLTYFQNLETITFPSGFNEVGCLEKCMSLKHITVPAGGRCGTAFGDCYKLASISFSKNCMTDYFAGFSGCINLKRLAIPIGAKRIWANACSGCNDLKRLVIPEGITDCIVNAFINCRNLKEVTLPSTLINFGNNIFAGDIELTKITILCEPTTLGASMFQSCYYLKTVVLPDTVTTIGNTTFDQCYRLTSVTLPSDITALGNTFFRGCYGLTALDLPENLTTIGDNVFDNCRSLESLEIPQTVVSIGSASFAQCWCLKEINIPSGITSLSNSLFDTCRRLTEITIPSGVTAIGTNVFANCTCMRKYHILPETPPTLSNINVFNGIHPDCIMYVPYSSDHSILAAYQSATNWSTYASYMQEEP